MIDERKPEPKIRLPILNGDNMPPGVDLPPPGFVHLYRVGENRIGVHHSDGRFELLKAEE